MLDVMLNVFRASHSRQITASAPMARGLFLWVLAEPVDICGQRIMPLGARDWDRQTRQTKQCRRTDDAPPLPGIYVIKRARSRHPLPDDVCGHGVSAVDIHRDGMR